MSSDYLAVHAATPRDVADLVGLMRAFYAESSYPLDGEWAAASFRRLLADPSLGCVWLARVGHRPVGHAVLTTRYTMEHGASSGCIDDLYVEPAGRRRGVGFALLQALLQEGRQRGLAALQVEVAQSNRAAIALYAKVGLLPITDGRVLLRGPIGAAPRLDATNDLR